MTTTDPIAEPSASNAPEPKSDDDEFEVEIKTSLVQTDGDTYQFKMTRSAIHDLIDGRPNLPRLPDGPHPNGQARFLGAQAILLVTVYAWDENGDVE